MSSDINAFEKVTMAKKEKVTKALTFFKERLALEFKSLKGGNYPLTCVHSFFIVLFKQGWLGGSMLDYQSQDCCFKSTPCQACYV